MTSATAPAVTAKRRLGAWSLWIALGTLIVVLPVVVADLRPIVLTYLDLDAGGTGGAVLRRLSTTLVRIALGLQGLGVCLGLLALFRSADSRGLGLLGVVLNGLALMVFLMVLGFTGAVE